MLVIGKLMRQELNTTKVELILASMYFTYAQKMEYHYNGKTISNLRLLSGNVIKHLIQIRFINRLCIPSN